MEKSVVRLKNIRINDLKNVAHGDLSFVNTRKSYQASILGLYGQNGSGKTSLIDSLSILKYALCGAPIPPKYADYVSVDADNAWLKYDISITDTELDTEYNVTYEINIREEISDDNGNIDGGFDGADAQKRLVLADEVLSVAQNGKSRTTQQPLIDTRQGELFGPKTKYDILIGKNKEIATDLIVAKKLSRVMSKSFIFSRDVIDTIKKNCTNEVYLFIFDNLVNYGNFGLFVIDTATSGLISLNALPLIFRHDKSTSGASESLMIPMNEGAVVPEDAMKPISDVVDNMNIVLTQIIPGLSIGVKTIGTQVMKDGKTGCCIQLMSHKNSRDIPIQYESDGIKKIIAILQMLIVVYNKHSVTVAIDELDAGVFEYLLGELLRIISEKGKGQLIFTSHNLRPLETLDKGFVAFTTTNPAHRYMRLCNVKTNNNLRDFYYRDIVLGEQSETMYEPTRNSEIALAFREAGEAYGS